MNLEDPFSPQQLDSPKDNVALPSSIAYTEAAVLHNAVGKQPAETSMDTNSSQSGTTMDCPVIYSQPTSLIRDFNPPDDFDMSDHAFIIRFAQRHSQVGIDWTTDAAHVAKIDAILKSEAADFQHPYGLGFDREPSGPEISSPMTADEYELLFAEPAPSYMLHPDTHNFEDIEIFQMLTELMSCDELPLSINKLTAHMRIEETHVSRK